MIYRSLSKDILDEEEPKLNLFVFLFGILGVILGVILIILSFLFSTLVPYRDITLVIAGALIGFFSISLDEYLRNFPERKKLYTYLRAEVNKLQTTIKTYGPEKEELDIMAAGFKLAHIVETGKFSQNDIDELESLLNRSNLGLNTLTIQKLLKMLPHSTEKERIIIAEKIIDDAKKILPNRENAAFRAGLDIFSLAVVLMHLTQKDASKIMTSLIDDFENILPNLTPETKITNFLKYIIKLKEQILNIVNNADADKGVELLRQISNSEEYRKLDLDRLIS